MAFLLVVFGALYLCNSWSRDFWSPEEIEFAEVAREMRSETGSLLLPTLGGRPYLEKPPFLYWSGLIFSDVFFLGPYVGYRLPAVLAGVLALWVTYAFGRLLFSARIGLVAMLIHGTTWLQFHNASWFKTDMPFAAGVQLATAAFALVILGRADSRRWIPAGYAGLAVAALFKSPLLALYLVAAPLLVFLWSIHGLRKCGAEIRRLRPLAGLAAVALVVLPWYVWTSLEVGSSFVEENLGEHHLERLFDATSHRQSGLYYFTTLPVDFLPWSFFLPLAFFYGAAHIRRATCRVLMLSVLVTFVTLSLISSKQGKYLLPMWSFLALLIAGGLFDEKRESIWEIYLGRGLLRGLPWLLKFLAAVAALAGVVVATGWIPPFDINEPARDLLTDGGFRTLATSLLLLLAGGLFFAGRKTLHRMRRGDLSDALIRGAAAFLLVYFGFTCVYGPLNQVKSGRSFAEAVAKKTGDEPLAIYGTARAGILYYLGRPPDGVPVLPRLDPAGVNKNPAEKLDAYLAADELRYLLMYQKDRRRLEGNYPVYADRYEEVLSGYVGSRREYVLLTNRGEGRAAEAEPETEAETGAEPKAVTEGEAEPDSEPETEPDSEADKEADREADSSSRDGASAEGETEPESGAEPETGSETESESQSESSERSVRREEVNDRPN